MAYQVNINPILLFLLSKHKDDVQLLRRSASEWSYRSVTGNLNEFKSEI